MPIVHTARPGVVDEAARLLASGCLVAFPTETVYGLGARADREDATLHIFGAKGRPVDHPLIVHVAEPASAMDFAQCWPAVAQRLVDRFWPGPLTLIVPRRAGVAEAAASGLATIGLRCPDHPVARELLERSRALGVLGIAAPSANRFGRVSPTRAEHVAEEFGDDLLVLDGGPCREGIESAIIDCSRSQPRLLRPGTLGRDALEAVLGTPLLGHDAAAPRVPGSLQSHYAPQAKLRLWDRPALLRALEQALSRSATEAPLSAGPVGIYASSVLPGEPSLPPGWVFRAMPDNPGGVAHELFAALRDFDAAGVQHIWVEMPPQEDAWLGVIDRLTRAASR